MQFIELNQEELARLDAGDIFITLKRPADSHAIPNGATEDRYVVRPCMGHKNRYMLYPVSALQINDHWNVVMRRVF